MDLPAEKRYTAEEFFAIFMFILSIPPFRWKFTTEN